MGEWMSAFFLSKWPSFWRHALHKDDVVNNIYRYQRRWCWQNLEGGSKFHSERKIPKHCRSTHLDSGRRHHSFWTQMEFRRLIFPFYDWSVSLDWKISLRNISIPFLKGILVKAFSTDEFIVNFDLQWIISHLNALCSNGREKCL